LWREKQFGIAIGFFAVVIVVGFLAALLTAPRGRGSVDRVDHASPALLEAIDKAKKSLPQVLVELKNPREGQRFAVMGRFSTPDGNEYLWLRDPVQKGSQIVATLDQKPIAAQMHVGDQVSLPPADVVDWMIRDPDGTVRGKFTENSVP
jgi:uncharacterized protein YegJ (DUF2314 family)